MAIVCPTHRLLFIQAPRTGCSAIEKVLLERFGGASVPPANILGPDGFIKVQRKHCTIRQLLEEGLIPDDYATRYTAFTTVRNPFDSLVSLYIKKRDKYQERLNDPTSWVHQVRGYVEDMEFCRTHTFDEWLTTRYHVGRIDRLLGKGRRSLYGRYTNGVELVLRFERLQDDFEQVMRQSGVTGDLTIPLFNATTQKKARYQDYYTPQTRDLVEYVFKGELDQFGYSFDGVTEAGGRARVSKAGR